MTKFFTCSLLLLSLVGCCGQGYVRVDSIQDTVAAISSRHDAYVKADESLSDLQKRIALRSTSTLGKTLKEAKEPNSTK